MSPANLGRSENLVSLGWRVAVPGEKARSPVAESWERLFAFQGSMDSVSLVLTLPVSLVWVIPAVLVRMVVVMVPLGPVLPLVAHLAGFPQSVKPVRSKNRSVPCGLCRNS